MPIGINWKVEGLRELGEALEGLTEAVRKRIMRRALRRAAEPVEATAKALAPVLKKPDPRRRAGTLRNAIRTAVMFTANPYEAAVKVGVKRLGRKKVSAFKTASGKSSTDNPDDPFYAHAVEKGGGNAPADPFLRPALFAHRENSVNLIRSTLKTEIEAEAKRQAQRHRRKL